MDGRYELCLSVRCLGSAQLRLIHLAPADKEPDLTVKVTVGSGSFGFYVTSFDLFASRLPPYGFSAAPATGGSTIAGAVKTPNREQLKYVEANL